MGPLLVQQTDRALTQRVQSRVLICGDPDDAGTSDNRRFKNNVRAACDGATRLDPEGGRVWLNGYYNGKRNNTTVESEAVKKNEEKVNQYCYGHRDATVMDAIKIVLGFDK